MLVSCSSASSSSWDSHTFITLSMFYNELILRNLGEYLRSIKRYTLKLFRIYWSIFKEWYSIVSGIACRLFWNNFRSFASARKRLMEYIKARLSCWSRASLKMRMQLVTQRARLTFQGLHYLRIVGGRSRYRLSNILCNKFFFITISSLINISCNSRFIISYKNNV